MTRYIAQFVRGGFPEIYAVMDTSTRPWTMIGEEKPYHDAIIEAHERSNGTWGQPKQEEPAAALWGWTLPGSPLAP